MSASPFETLEQAITNTGRARVFAMAESLGHNPGAAIPTWVWWGIIDTIRLADFSGGHEQYAAKDRTSE